MTSRLLNFFWWEAEERENEYLNLELIERLRQDPDLSSGAKGHLQKIEDEINEFGILKNDERFDRIYGTGKDDV